MRKVTPYQARKLKARTLMVLSGFKDESSSENTILLVRKAKFKEGVRQWGLVRDDDGNGFRYGDIAFHLLEIIQLAKDSAWKNEERRPGVWSMMANKKEDFIWDDVCVVTERELPRVKLLLEV